MTKLWNSKLLHWLELSNLRAQVVRGCLFWLELGNGAHSWWKKKRIIDQLSFITITVDTDFFTNCCSREFSLFLLSLIIIFYPSMYDVVDKNACTILLANELSPSDQPRKLDENVAMDMNIPLACPCLATTCCVFCMHTRSRVCACMHIWHNHMHRQIHTYLY